MENVYDEEVGLHQEITLDEYMKLDEEKRKSDNIYFITDVDNEIELINRLSEQMKILQEELEEVVADGLDNA